MSDMIDDFINKYYPKSNQSSTRRGYKSALKLFFQTIDREPTQEYLNIYDERGYINNNRVMEIEDDLETFFNYLQTNKSDKKRDFTTPTISRYISKVNNFLKLNRIYVSLGILKSIHDRNMGGDEVVSVKGTLKPEQLREVLANCNPMYKTLFLILATSGIRIGEGVKLEEKHIKKDEKPVRLTIDAFSTKKRRRRNTFITEEAKRYYLNWMKKRDEYIKERKTKVTDETIVKSYPNEKYIFPIGKTTASRKWKRVVENTEFNETDNTTGRLKYSLHSLRRFFVNQLEEISIDKRSIDFMKDGILSTGGYTDFDRAVENAKKEYNKGKHLLRVFVSGIPEEEYHKIKQMELEKSRMVLEEKEKTDIKVAEAVEYSLRHNYSAKIMEDLRKEKALVEEIKRKHKIEREYSIIISKILLGEIAVSEHEKNLVREFGIEGLPKNDEELDYLIKNNLEFVDLCELIERIIAERQQGYVR